MCMHLLFSTCAGGSDPLLEARGRVWLAGKVSVQDMKRVTNSAPPDQPMPSSVTIHGATVSSIQLNNALHQVGLEKVRVAGVQPF